jgi:hypothetical protein
VHLLALLLLQDTIRQQEWKIERLTKDNRALEASNCELRAQLETVKEENLQVGLKMQLQIPMQLLMKQKQDTLFGTSVPCSMLCTVSSAQ